MNLSGKLPHVVIIGAGFGGLNAARALAGTRARVTLIDRNNYHLFQPLLYQVATSSLSADSIAQPVRSILGRQANLEFRMAEVYSIDLANRSLKTSGGTLSYDYLVVAAGGATNYFGMDGLARFAGGLKDVADAEGIRDHILRLNEEALHERDPRQAQAALTFVVAGGGPTGVESAGAVAELVQHVLPREYPPEAQAARARVLLLEAGERLLPAMPESLAAHTLRALRRKGVEVRFGAAVSAFDGSTVRLRSGEAIAARTLIWAAGIQAAGVARALPLEKGSQGRVKVLPTLQAPGHAEVYVIGDAAYLEDAAGRPLPMLAPVAIQQGLCAAGNIARALAGEPQRAFRYRDPGTMATIGRGQAVAQIGPFKLSGLPAWLAWVVVHIYQLVGFRNRLVVMMDWAWNYIVYDRPVRLVGARRRHSPAPEAVE